MASFAQGLAQGLSGLPQALMYGQDKRRKDAYRKEISGLSDVSTVFNPEEAARVALKHGDLDSALSYRRMAAEAKTRSAAGERQQGLDDIAAEDRARRHATEDEATGSIRNAQEVRQPFRASPEGGRYRPRAWTG